MRYDRRGRRGELPIPIAIQRRRRSVAPVGPGRIGRAGVEAEVAPGVVEDDEVRDPAEVEDRAARGRAPSDPRPKRTASAIGESGPRRRRRRRGRGSPRSRGDRPDRDDVAIADFERRTDGPVDTAIVIDRLAMRADQVDVPGDRPASRWSSRADAANTSPIIACSSATPRTSSPARLMTRGLTSGSCGCRGSAAARPQPQPPAPSSGGWRRRSVALVPNMAPPGSAGLAATLQQVVEGMRREILLEP